MQGQKANARAWGEKWDQNARCEIYPKKSAKDIPLSYNVFTGNVHCGLESSLRYPRQCVM